MPCMRCCRSAREETSRAIRTVSRANRRAFLSHIVLRAQAGTDAQISAGSAFWLCTKTMPLSAEPHQRVLQVEGVHVVEGTNSTCSSSECTRMCCLAIVK